MSALYRPPEPLTERHDRSGFQCESTEQAEWLRRYARQSMRSGTTRVFVVAESDSNQAVAYYAWCMAQVRLDDAPVRLRPGAGRYSHPVALVARLGVDSAHVGQGLGAGMLQDVLVRVSGLSVDIGCRGLLVHAESQAARDFYLHVIPEFEPSPTDELHLILLMKDIRRTLGT